MPNRKRDTQPSRLRWAWAGMVEWSWLIAITIPQTMPAITKSTAARKLRIEAFIRFPLGPSVTCIIVLDRLRCNPAHRGPPGAQPAGAHRDHNRVPSEPDE